MTEQIKLEEPIHVHDDRPWIDQIKDLSGHSSRAFDKAAEEIRKTEDERIINDITAAFQVKRNDQAEHASLAMEIRDLLRRCGMPV